MAYQAIYRKWRPMVFDDVVGQTHVTRTLKNQIMNHKTAHAYLFCGTRGTGKTTAAKIFSRAVNCTNSKDGNPCNECDVCKGILDGSVLDVTEIDAASNNGVDDIRQIRDEVVYSASVAKYKIYIIDEVHMLSAGAFNALLKTLEEPPEHVIFILATTEVHKLPQTILSRCQRFDFKRIKVSDIVVRMKEIAYGDGFDVTDDALNMIATLADGSMRDGLSILERCLLASQDKLTADEVSQIMGGVNDDTLYKTVQAVIDSDTKTLININDSLFAAGSDMNSFINSLIKYCRDLMVCKVAPDIELDYNSDFVIKLKRQSEKISIEKISNMINVLSSAVSTAKWAPNVKIVYELALIKLTRTEFDVSYDALLDRVSTLEQQIKDGVTVKVEKNESVAETSKQPEAERAEEKPEKNFSVTKPFKKGELTADNVIVKAAKSWAKILGALETVPGGVPVYAQIFRKKITIDAEGIVILFEENEQTSKQIVSLPMNLNNIKKAVKRVTGNALEVKAVFEKDVDDIIDFNAIASDNESANESAETAPVKTDSVKTDSVKPDPAASAVDTVPAGEGTDAQEAADAYEDAPLPDVDDYDIREDDFDDGIDPLDNVIARAAQITEIEE